MSGISQQEAVARAIYAVTLRWVKPNFPRDHHLRSFDELDERERRLNLEYAEAALGVQPPLPQVDELLRDKARLDFLDEMNCKLNAWAGTIYRWKLILNHNVNRLMLGHMQVDLHDQAPHAHASCRLAIDEEMSRILRDRKPIPLTPPQVSS